MFSYDPAAGSDNAAHNIRYNGVPLDCMTAEELRQMGVEMFNKMVGEMPAVIAVGEKDRMIFTIGHRETYLKAIARQGEIYKTGRREPCEKFPNGYPGGYAFASIEDAQKRIEEAYEGSGMAVFGLLADWGRDTVPSPDGWWHDLVTDAPVVVLAEGGR